MKAFALIVSLALFIGGLLLFGYAFAFADGWNTLAFCSGIAAIALSLIIPFHLLERTD